MTTDRDAPVRPDPGLRPSRLHDTDRLRLRDAASDLDEACRVADVLHIHENDFDGRMP
jgi:hypothetical protein